EGAPRSLWSHGFPRRAQVTLEQLFPEAHRGFHSEAQLLGLDRPGEAKPHFPVTQSGQRHRHALQLERGLDSVLHGPGERQAAPVVSEGFARGSLDQRAVPKKVTREMLRAAITARLGESEDLL